METKKIILPEGWEIDKVEGNEIILKESKSELPKTWEECYKRLGEGEYIDSNSLIRNCDLHYAQKCNYNMLPHGLGKPFLALCQLFVCREIYRKGWKPDWEKDDCKYCIEVFGNEIKTGTYTNMQRILSFQSEKVRDDFFKNFRDLIEQAKELI